MFLKKSLPAVKYKTFSVAANFKRGSVPLSEKLSFNATCKNGALCSARGIAEVLKVPNVFGAVDFGRNMAIFTQNGTKIRFEGNLLDTALHHKTPIALYERNRNLLLLSEAGNGTVTVDALGEVRTVCPQHFVSLALCREKIFGITNSGAMFVSEQEDFTNWQNYINLPQPVRALATLQGKLIALGNGVWEIRVDADLTESKIVTVCENIGNVYQRSVATVGKKVFFLTDEGLKVFFQNRVKTVPLPKPSSNCLPYAAAHGGNYYLCYTTQDGNRFTAEVDGESEQLVACYDIDCCPYSTGRLLFVKNGAICTFSQEDGAMFWQSVWEDFGMPFVKKCFKKLNVKTARNIDVHLVTESERRIFHISGGAHPQKIALSGSFFRCRVEIFAECGGEVTLGLDVCARQREVM